jgi:hypothetical protein
MTSNDACANPATATSNSVTATVNTTPTISKNGNVLTSSASSGNQWYLNGQPLSGAVASSYTANVSGSYTVTVAGCTSQSLNVTVNDIDDIERQHSFSVYPNPGCGNFNLSFTLTIKEVCRIEIKNELGQIDYK